MEHKSPELLKAAPKNVLSKPVPLYYSLIRWPREGKEGLLNCWYKFRDEEEEEARGYINWKGRGRGPKQLVQVTGDRTTINVVYWHGRLIS